MRAPDSPFAEAAAYYSFRAPYAPEAFGYLRDTFRLDKNSRVLDLGSGPGTIAIPMARMVKTVVAVEPCAEMIELGRARAAEAGCKNISWQQAKAEALKEDRSTFSLVTIGQAFHWMDRDVVLARLGRMTTQQGGIALINPGRRRPQESWETLANDIVAQYLGPRTWHPYMSAEREHEPALLRSACFSQFTTREFAIEFTRNIASILGCIYSMSSSPRAAFGERVATFERELEKVLMSINPSGVFPERVETEVLVARRNCLHMGTVAAARRDKQTPRRG